MDSSGLNLRSGTKSFLLEDTTYIYYCIATDKKLSTPAGVFNCYVYYHRKDIAKDVVGVYDIYDYVTPHIGLIMQEEFITVEEPGDSTSYLYGRSTLNNYHLIK